MFCFLFQTQCVSCGSTGFGIENEDALLPYCGVHYLWFAFVCFLNYLTPLSPKMRKHSGIQESDGDPMLRQNRISAPPICTRCLGSWGLGTASLPKPTSKQVEVGCVLKQNVVVTATTHSRLFARRFCLTPTALQSPEPIRMSTPSRHPSGADCFTASLLARHRTTIMPVLPPNMHNF